MTFSMYVCGYFGYLDVRLLTGSTWLDFQIEQVVRVLLLGLSR